MLLYAHARVEGGVPFMLGRVMEAESFESYFPSLSVGFGHDPGQVLRR